MKRSLQCRVSASCFVPLFGRWLSQGRARWIRTGIAGGWFLFSAVVFAQSQDHLDYNAPWPDKVHKANKDASTKVVPAAQPASPPANPPATPPPAATPAPAPGPAAVTSPPPGGQTPPPDLFAEPKETKNEISASGDYFLGQGKVTLPFGFSLTKLPGLGPNIHESVGSASRSSTYFGGTLSYSFGQAWYFDVAYASGDSSGNKVFNPLIGPINSDFSIKDDWYRGYVRYTFPSLRGKRFSAYLRGGITYVSAKLNLTDFTIPSQPLYLQTDKTTDVLGNLGFGVRYDLFRWGGGRYRLSAQAEGEGFYGRRNQDSQESLPAGPLNAPTVHIDNDLYGGIGRATLHFEYRIGESQLLRVFAEGGYQGTFTIINYSGVSAPNEQLYGPYAKLGLEYSF